MPGIVNGKYRIIVSINPKDYELIRRLAYEMDLTVNECLRVVTLEEAKQFLKDG